MAFMKSSRLLIAVIASLPLAACGTEPAERTLSGMGIGAAAGIATGALVGGSGAVAGGLILGTFSGAVIGGLTRPEYVYLGEPWWDPVDDSQEDPKPYGDPNRRRVGEVTW